jgi:hypothetical protein
MSVEIFGVPSVPTRVDQEVATGVLAQKAESTRATPTFSGDSDLLFGVPICMIFRHEAAADQAYDSAAAIVEPLGSKAALGQKYRIVKVETTLRVLRTGGSPDHDWKLQKGDGAESEAFSDIVATVDVDTDTVDLATARAVVAAQAVIETGKTLRSQFQVSGTTTTGTGEFEVCVWCVPTNA